MSTETTRLDRCQVTRRMRDAARAAGVTGDDAAVQRWHAGVSRALAAATARLHEDAPPAELAAGSHTKDHTDV